ncbi:glycosyltransferase family 61 protein [Pedobacter sp. MW01-1-1]|uniref:glycosyltransferase family 61 protein n=1 Tax=Pedobacter sp. MW01-1-1 TaxID=3383027 RepID=UPI003FF067F7
MSILRLLKKITILLFTHNPYKIRAWDKLQFITIGQPVENLETLSAKLYEESGELSYYSTTFESYGQILNHRFFKNTVPRFKEKGLFKNPDRKVFSLENGCILGHLGLVYSPEKRTFIHESAIDWSKKLQDIAYTNAFKMPEIKKLKGITLSFLSIGADGGFYHFLFESLAKWGIFKSILANCDHLLFNGPATDWKLKWMHQAEIDTKKIIWVDAKSHFQCEQLIFSNRLIHDQQINTWCIDRLKEMFAISILPRPIRQEKVIWISRKNLVNRNLVWENELLQKYPQIEVIDLTSLSARESINIMQHASHVIGPHGAGLSNIYLCEENTKILELFPHDSFFQPCYARLAQTCRLKYSTFQIDFRHTENETFGFNKLNQVLKDFLC